MKEITVDMADFSFGESPQILIVKGLGSCVSVCLYQKEARVGALSHVMLPESHKGVVTGNPLRFMDKMLEKVFEEFKSRGFSLSSLEAKLVGGADMFPFLNQQLIGSVAMGEKNVSMAKKILHDNGIVIIAEEIGGHHGRSLQFHLDTGIVTVEKKI